MELLRSLRSMYGGVIPPPLHPCFCRSRIVSVNKANIEQGRMKAEAKATARGKRWRQVRGRPNIIIESV